MKSRISCRDNEVGENWGDTWKKKVENHQNKVAKHSHMLQLFHGTFFTKATFRIRIIAQIIHCNFSASILPKAFVGYVENIACNFFSFWSHRGDFVQHLP